jgi:hypothetical protein
MVLSRVVSNAHIIHRPNEGKSSGRDLQPLPTDLKDMVVVRNMFRLTRVLNPPVPLFSKGGLNINKVVLSLNNQEKRLPVKNVPPL